MNKMIIVEKYKQAVVEMVKGTVDKQMYLDPDLVDVRLNSIIKAVNLKHPGLIEKSKLVWMNYGNKCLLFYQLCDDVFREYEFKF